MNEIVANFQRMKWGEERTKIDAMELGDSEKFSMLVYNNVWTSAQRTKHAYGDRRFSITTWNDVFWLTRVL